PFVTVGGARLPSSPSFSIPREYSPPSTPACLASGSAEDSREARRAALPRLPTRLIDRGQAATSRVQPRRSASRTSSGHGTPWDHLSRKPPSSAVLVTLRFH